MSLNWLYDVISDRKEHPTSSSYTASLFSAGMNHIVQKVGEEATEIVIAALQEDNQRLIEEIADLTYHVLVLMAAKGIQPSDIFAELKRRHR
jgi:phosphoribosyl-ATP pyrophosphohydrolase